MTHTFQKCNASIIHKKITRPWEYCRTASLETSRYFSGNYVKICLLILKTTLITIHCCYFVSYRIAWYVQIVRMSATNRHICEKSQRTEQVGVQAGEWDSTGSTHVTFWAKHSSYYINPKEKGRERKHACLGRKMVLEQRHTENKKDERYS